MALLLIPQLIQADPLRFGKRLPLRLGQQLLVHPDDIRCGQLFLRIISALVVAPFFVTDHIAGLLILVVLRPGDLDLLRHRVLLRTHLQVLLWMGAWWMLGLAVIVVDLLGGYTQLTGKFFV